MKQSRRMLSVVVLLAAAMLALVGGPPMAGAEPRVVTVAVHELQPFVMQEDNRYSGFTIEVWEQIAKREGWQTNYLSVGNVKEQLAAVADRRADVAAGAISITAERMRSFDFSQPTLNGGLQILVPESASMPSQPGLMGFLHVLLSKSMLIWLLVGMGLAVLPAHILWLIERRHADSMVSRNYFPGIFQAFGWGFSTLAGAADDTPRHWLTRALATIWAFVAIIFVAYYTATLTANLTVQKIANAITSPGDLVGRKVCTVANTTSAGYLGELGVTPTGLNSIDDCFRALKDGQFDAVVFDAPVLQYFAANGGAGSVQLAGTIFSPEDYGLAVRTGDPLRKAIDEGLLSMREDGTYDGIKRKWFGDPADLTAAG